MAVISFFIAFAGLAFGSFVDAMAWRLHTKRNFITGRSECEHCHHTLGAFDLIPVLSWVLLRGKCRYCHTAIPILAPLTEIVMGGLFVASYLFWPFGFETWQAGALFFLWLVYLVNLGILFVYDLRWGLLPDVIVYPLIILGFLDAGLRVSLAPQASITEYANHVVLGIAAMAGVYGALYLMTRKRGVGLGDVKLAVFMGAVLGWQKTLVVLMLANIIGLLLLAPALLRGRLSPKSAVPFGPFMIAAFVIVGLWGDGIIDWYIRSFIVTD